MKQLEEKRRNDKALLIEGCKEMYSDIVKMTNDWDETLMDGLETD